MNRYHDTRVNKDKKPFDHMIIIMSVSTSRGINLSQFYENDLGNVTKKT